MTYKFIWGNTQTLLTVQMNLLSLKKNPDIPWNSIHNVLEVATNNRITCYHGSNDLQSDIKTGKLYLDKELAHKHINNIINQCNQHQKLFDKIIETKLNKLNLEDLIKLIHQIVDQWCKTIAYFRGIQAEGTHYLIKSIQQHVGDKELAVLLTPVEPDVIHDELEDRQKLKQKDNNECLKHLQKYPWLAANVYSRQEAFDIIKDNSRIEEHSNVDNLRQKQERILAKHSKIRNEVATAQKLSILRSLVKSKWAGSDFFCLMIFEQISRITKETVHDLMKYYLLEDIDALLNQKLLSSQEKKNRDELFVGLFDKGSVVLASGKKAHLIVIRELGQLPVTKQSTQITGVVANSGFARGIVFILHANDGKKAKELRKTFTKGSILITEMTQPNILDIARLAGAIVTDEGGMLSHAAIISREFGIPCIVGTSKATKVFNDGDTLEVDATKGIVRKL